MGRREKLAARFRSKPRDFSWNELVRLLEELGYREAATGKTGGSRRRFVHDTAPTIAVHKPHPGNIVWMYVIEDVLRLLTEEGLI
jgi:predicted RNA binding protein YcfA (HicA-like mRNA interferase family)